MAEPTLTADDFVEALRANLPPGPIWAFVQSIGMGGYIAGSAPELARLHVLVATLIAEANPCRCDALLDEWLEVAALPDPAWQDPPATEAESKAALCAYVTMRAGQRADELEAHVLRTLGVVVTITTGAYTPFLADLSDADDVLYDGTAAFLFDVEYPAALAADALDRLQCFVNRFKPAHCVANFVAV